MAGPIVNSCCGCQSLRSGSIVTGILGIILSLLTIILVFVSRVEFKTILLDWLPAWVVKVIVVINLAMTILISILLIIGIVKRNYFLMLPWVVLGIVLAVGLLVSIIYTAIVYFIDGFLVVGLLVLIFGIISTIIYVYLWIVVYSHFTVIKEEADRGLYSKQPYRR